MFQPFSLLVFQPFHVSRLLRMFWCYKGRFSSTVRRVFFVGVEVIKYIELVAGHFPPLILAIHLSTQDAIRTDRSMHE